MRRRVLLLAGMGAAAAQPAETAVVLRIVGGEVAGPQRRIAAFKGDRLRWRIESDQPGELHLHAYRLVVRVEPGRIAELAFVANATGRFPVSWLGDGAAAKTGHAHAPLAWLEVRPR